MAPSEKCKRPREAATGEPEPDAAVVAPDFAFSGASPAGAEPAPSRRASPPAIGPTVPRGAAAATADGPLADAAAVENAATSPDCSFEGAVPLYFLTNRMNLNGVLSSRIIAPRESYKKYYSDLLEDVPGWVPLFTRPPSKALLERVSTERGAGGPVILELSLPRARGGDPHLDVLFVRASLLSDVRAIHFPDQRTVREHRARAYGNVHAHGELLRVTPGLFTSDLQIEAELTAPSEGTLEVDWQRLDRIRGALNGLLAASSTGEALAIAAAVLGASGAAAKVRAPRWLRWVELTEGSIDAAPGSVEQTADHLIYWAAYHVLGLRDSKVAWSPAEVLDSVERRVIAARPSDTVMKMVDRYLRRVRELVSAERDFERFRRTGSPYVAAKSLVLVLTRPDLEQLLAWSPEDTGADETTMLGAAVLAGRLRGLARESATLRSSEFDDLTAAWAVRSINGGGGSLGRAEFASRDSETALLVDGRLVAESTPLGPDPVAR